MNGSVLVDSVGEQRQQPLGLGVEDLASTTCSRTDRRAYTSPGPAAREVGRVADVVGERR